MSRPPRARGLKLSQLALQLIQRGSRPPRARGLKRNSYYWNIDQWWVAPPAGAWIETDYIGTGVTSFECRAPRGRVD